MKFYVLVSSFAVGIAAGSIFKPSLITVALPLLVFGAVTLYIWKFIPNLFQTTFSTVVIALLGITLGLTRIALVAGPSHELDAFVGEKTVLEGVIVAEPDQRDNNTHLVVNVEVPQDQKVLEGKVLVFAARYPEFEYGDRVKIEGKLTLPKSFETDTGRMFDYPAYLAKDGTGYTMSFASVTLAEKDQGNFIQALLFSVKHKFIKAIGRAFPEPQASLLSGIILGGKQALGKEINDEFKIAGLSHIIVLSGYNITVVSNTLQSMFSLLSQSAGLFAGAVGVLMFVLMSGAGASAVRAAIMVFIVLLARGIGRKYDPLRALCVAALLMVLHNPLILLFDPSFELSFLATLGLVVVSPLVANRLYFISEKWKLRETIATTISVQMFVLPFILYMSGMLSFISFPTNILVLPLMPVLMFTGFLAGVFALVSSLAGIIIGFPTYIMLSYILKVVEVASSWSFSAITLPAFSAWFLIPIYGAYGYFIYRMQQTMQDVPTEEKVEISEEAMAYEIIE